MSERCICDGRLLFGLRMRHIRTSSVRLLYVTGSDYVRDRERTERVYQAYILIALVKAAPLAALVGYLVGVAAQVALPGAAGPLVFSAYATFAICAAVAASRAVGCIRLVSSFKRRRMRALIGVPLVWLLQLRWVSQASIFQRCVAVGVLLFLPRLPVVASFRMGQPWLFFAPPLAST